MLFQGEPIRTFDESLLRFRTVQKDDLANKFAKTVLPRPGAVESKKWAVTTTIHPPTQAIVDFTNRNDWAI